MTDQQLPTISDLSDAEMPELIDQNELLARHVPILALDERELFGPTAVDRYVESSVLRDHTGASLSVTVADLDDRVPTGSHLRFISDEDRRLVGRQDLRHTAQRLFAGRLGRVGLFGRLLDAMFRLSVQLRPTVPKRTTAAAAIKARRFAMHDTSVCYGRVARCGEWIVLHYAWFYVMNDWRSSYRGLNDHEADWEQAWIYCDPADLSPVWIAATSHEHRGADMRRHVADPEITMEDGHPVLYVAAGSHALFFQPGDYVTRIDIPGFRWVQQMRRSILRVVWRKDSVVDEGGLGPALGVPFVDSAPGDGERISDWEIRPLAGPWVESFRGLWGLDTGDPLQGERGPSGPKFDRTGEIRASWADPLGFADLHGSPPPSAAAARINIDKIDRSLEDLDEQIRQRGRLLPLAHRTRSPHDMRAESETLTELLRQRCELEGLRRRFLDGRIGEVDIRHHLRRTAVPLESGRGGNWLLTGWASISIPLLIASFAAVALLDTVQLVATTMIVAVAVLVVELLAHGRLRLVAELALVVLAVVAGAVWAFEPVIAVVQPGLVARWLTGGGLFVAAGGLLLANLREIRLSSRRS